MIHNFTIKYKNIILLPIAERHLEMLRKYRNLKTVSKYLRNVGYISKSKQIKWFDSYKEDRKIYGFIIRENKILKRDVGSIFLYNITKKKAEIGKVVIGDKNAHHLSLCKNSIIALSTFGFKMLKFKKLIAKIYVNNIPSIVSFIKAGYIINKKTIMPNNEFQYILYKELKK